MRSEEVLDILDLHIFCPDCDISPQAVGQEDVGNAHYLSLI